MKLQRLTAILLLTTTGIWRGASQTTINPVQSRVGGPASNRPSGCVTGQMWLATDTGMLSYCSSSGDPGTWKTLTSSGVSSGADSLCVVPLSGTPVFDAANCSAFQLALGNTAVTASSLVNARAGQELTFLISQDAAGGRSFAWPANLANACAISMTAGVTTIVTAIYDGTQANTTYCTTTDDGTLVTGPTRSAPATPAAGLSCWFDGLPGGGGNWKCKDTSGNVRASVLTATAATPNQVMKYIDADGVAHTSGVAEQELSLSDVTTGDASTAAHGFLPKLPGDNSKCLLGDGTYGSCGTGGGGGGGYTMNTGGVYAPLDGVFSILHQGVNWQVAPLASNGKWECYQWTAPVAIKLSNLFTIRGGNGTANDVFVAAVYQDSSNTPGVKVSNSEVVVTGNTGISYTFVPWGSTRPTLQPGPYWMCYSNSNATANWYTDPDQSLPTVLGFLSPPRRVTCQNTVTYNGSSTTLPNTCSGPTASISGSLPYMVIAQ
jgi:hypothetical protein